MVNSQRLPLVFLPGSSMPLMPINVSNFQDKHDQSVLVLTSCLDARRWDELRDALTEKSRIFHDHHNGSDPTDDALRHAVVTGNEEGLQVMLAHPALKSDRQRINATLLVAAVENRQPGCLKVLLEQGRVSPEARQSALFEVLPQAPHELTDLLVDLSDAQNISLALRFVAGRGDLEKVEHYLAYSDDIGRDVSLVEAATHNHPDCLHVLLPTVTAEHFREQALHKASIAGHESCVRMLMSSGVPATPQLVFDVALTQREPAMVSFLLQHVPLQEVLNLVADNTNRFSLPRRAAAAEGLVDHIPKEMISELALSFTARAPKVWARHEQQLLDASLPPSGQPRRPAPRV